MPRFIIHASETAFYEIEVEADSRDEAEKELWNTNFTNIDPCDYGNFEINEIEEITENEDA